MFDLPRNLTLPMRFLCERKLALALGAALAVFTPGQADERVRIVAEARQAGVPVQATPSPAQIHVLTLAECLQLAMERQPALHAHRSSLAAAQNAYDALEKLRIPTLIARDLPIRRHQAMLGISVAAATLEQAEHETIYAVERLYFTVVFAREQERVANTTVERISLTRDTVARHKGAGKDVTEDDLTKVTVYLRLAESKQIQASEGVNRAMAALREAIGLAPDCCFQVAIDVLPDSRWQICRDDIIGWALSRRGEMTQAGLAAEITSLEVDAQATTHRPRKETFAAAGDIHAKQVPYGVANGEYRPGAVSPEMPTLLAGCKSQRMERARSLSARAAAVADKTRNLIVLDAEDAFLKWQEATRKVPGAREAANLSNKLAEDRLAAYRGDANASIADVLNDRILGAQAQASLNEALYQQILALVALERVTAGGFRAGFSGIAGPTAEVRPTNQPTGSEKMSVNHLQH